MSRWVDAVEPVALLNAAALAQPDRAAADPAMSAVVNAQAPAALARLARRRGLRLLHLSTDYVLDGPDLPGHTLDEATPPAPRSVYAQHKRQGEEAVLAEDGAVVRIQWAYSTSGSGFFARCLRQLHQGQTLRLVTDQVGSPTPAALLAPALLHAARSGPTGLFHLACSGEASPWTWLEAAARHRGLSFRAVPLERAELGGVFRPARSCLNSDRFAATFGLRLPPWEEALAQVLSG